MADEPKSPLPPMPPQPTTKALPAADKLSLQFSELRMLVVNGFKTQDAKMESRLDKVDLTLDTFAHQYGVLRNEVTGLSVDLSTFKASVVERLAKNSDRARHPSAVDLEIKAIQGLEIAKNQDQDKAIAETRAIVGDVVDKIGKVNAALQAQSDFMGMGKRGLTWLGSKEGRTALAQLAAAIVFVYEALKHGGVIR